MFMRCFQLFRRDTECGCGGGKIWLLTGFTHSVHQGFFGDAKGCGGGGKVGALVTLTTLTTTSAHFAVFKYDNPIRIDGGWVAIRRFGHDLILSAGAK